MIGFVNVDRYNNMATTTTMRQVTMMVNDHVPLMDIARQLNISESRLQDLLIKIARLNENINKKYIECPICMEDTNFEADMKKMPVQTPCCRQYLCVSCVKAGIKNVSDHKHFHCYFCRTDCVISNQISNYFE
jgi:hypothetical protein